MFTEHQRHNLTWFYPKICRFQDDPRSLDGVLQQSLSADTDTLLYIHIPFCDSLCAYCGCFKEPLGAFDADELSDFVTALLREMALIREMHGGEPVKVRYVQFGGGTPSTLPVPLLSRIFEGLSTYWDMSECEGISFEGNVMSLRDAEKLRALKSFGVTRVSFGVQTFNTRLRRALRIKAKLADVFEARAALQSAGIDSVAADLIHNLPGESLEILDNDLATMAYELAPSLIQTYQFNQLNNTRLDQRIRDGALGSVPTPEREAEMSRYIADRLPALGYPHRPLINLYSRAAERLWTGIDLSLGGGRAGGARMIGLGPGSMTYLLGSSHRNVLSVRDYVSALREDRLPIECGAPLAAEEQAHKVMAMFPALMRIRKDSVPTGYGFETQLEEFVADGLVIDEGGEYVLTEEGTRWAGSISYAFFSENEVRRNKVSYLESLRSNKNPFNQDDMNVTDRQKATR